MPRLIPIALLCGLATASLAHEGVKDPQVMARMHSMSQISAAFKTLVAMAKQEVPLHQAKARMARDTLITHSLTIPDLFEVPATDPKSEALPTLWDNWDDFTTKAEQLTKAAQGLDFKDRAALADTLGAVGGSCRACHKPYREKK